MLEELLYINEQFPWFFRITVFVLGACWGSFLNVVIYRVPAGKSVVTPGSTCACGKPIAFYDNIPILSWLILRGKARCCDGKFSIRYPMVELLTGCLFLACWWMNQDNLTVAIIGCLFIALMICGTFIDLDHMTLPDFVIIGGTVVGVLLSLAFPELHEYTSNEPWLLRGMRAMIVAMVGAVAGSGVILWIAMIAEAVLKKEAMGFGDVLLMGCIGAFCGWEGALFAIFGGAVGGTCIVIPLIIVQKIFGITIRPGVIENETTDEQSKTAEAAQSEATKEASKEAKGEDEEEALQMGTRIPFGPWLALGGVVYYIFLRDAVDAYFLDVSVTMFRPMHSPTIQ